MKALISVLAMTAGLALAQGPGGPPMRGPMGPGMMGMMRVGGAPVKGAPYQAVTVMETNQVLTDGTHVNSKQAGKVYRDSQGRTRTESSMRGFGPFRAPGAAVNMVNIDDPVAQQHVMLDSNRKTATKLAMHQRPEAAAGTGTAGTHGKRGPASTGATRPEAVKENLGTQVMEGLNVTGTRVTTTIAAGTMGNDRAISIVTETWFSADLQTVVYRKHTDPWNGESIYRLTEIQRTEPDASLFQVPGDYTVTTPQMRRNAPPAQQQ